MGPSPEGARAIAEAGYVFLLPLVANYRTMYAEAIDPSSPMFGGGFDRWIHLRRAASRETDVSSSHATTLTSSAWLDLRTEPLVLSVSAVEAPVMVRINDLWGFAVDEVGRTVDDEYALVVATRGWVGAVPAGVDRITRCETSFDRCTLWVDLTEPADSGRVRDIQRAYRLEPLSTWTGGTPTDPAPAITWWPVPESVMTSDEFWSVASFALSLTTPDEQDRGILDRLAELGIRAGARWDPSELPGDIAAAIGEGMDHALTELMRAVDAHDLTPMSSRADNDRDYFGRALAVLRAMPAADARTA